jgi:hypothetical protein
MIEVLVVVYVIGMIFGAFASIELADWEGSEIAVAVLVWPLVLLGVLVRGARRLLSR